MNIDYLLKNIDNISLILDSLEKELGKPYIDTDTIINKCADIDMKLIKIKINILKNKNN